MSSKYNHINTILHKYYLNKDINKKGKKSINNNADDQNKDRVDENLFNTGKKLTSEIAYSSVSGILIPKNFVSNHLPGKNTNSINDINNNTEIKNHINSSDSSISDSDSSSEIFSCFRCFEDSYSDCNY